MNSYSHSYIPYFTNHLLHAKTFKFTKKTKNNKTNYKVLVL